MALEPYYNVEHKWQWLFQVTTTTKTIREVQYIGPDGQPIDFIPGENGGQFAYDPQNHISDYQNHQFGDYGMYPVHYQDYNRPPTPPTPSERSTSPLPSHRVPGRNTQCYLISSWYLHPGDTHYALSQVVQNSLSKNMIYKIWFPSIVGGRHLNLY